MKWDDIRQGGDTCSIGIAGGWTLEMNSGDGWSLEVASTNRDNNQAPLQALCPAVWFASHAD
jgi:hypothetical protein